MHFPFWKLYKPDGTVEEIVGSFTAQEIAESWQKENPTVAITVSEDGLFVTLVG